MVLVRSFIVIVYWKLSHCFQGSLNNQCFCITLNLLFRSCFESMSSYIYPILNAILFGIVLLEVLFQISFSFINKQKLKRYNCFIFELYSHYFLFLVFTFIWTILRGILSIPVICSNSRLLYSILDFIYPSINCSFLILSRHYITVLFFISIKTRWFLKNKRKQQEYSSSSGTVL